MIQGYRDRAIRSAEIAESRFISAQIEQGIKTVVGVKKYSIPEEIRLRL